MRDVKLEREKMILAMEYIARQINDEDVFECWLTSGPCDGDIPYGCIDPAQVDEYYLEDNTFKDIMSAFLWIMMEAFNSGGLYCDHVVCKDKNDYKNEL